MFRGREEPNIFGEIAACRSAVCKADRWCLLALGLIACGCSNSPPRVEAPSWAPQRIADRVIEQFDNNADSAISRDEAEAAPGLAAGFHRIDKNQDDQLSREEIQQRFALYKKLGTGLVSRTFQVVLNGRPLRDTQIVFLPEYFQGGVIQPAQGMTDSTGIVVPRTEGQDIPAMQIGFYRVQIDSQDSAAKQPPEASALVGVEVSPISEGDETGTPVLRFKR